jgi:hypothetical protein
VKFRHGDRVWIKNLGVEGEVVEVRTRAIIVRFDHKGESVDRHFIEDDLDRLPTTKEQYFEHPNDHSAGG